MNEAREAVTQVLDLNEKNRSPGLGHRPKALVVCSPASESSRWLTPWTRS
jgi:hypothetical protein